MSKSTAAHPTARRAALPRIPARLLYLLLALALLLAAVFTVCHRYESDIRDHFNPALRAVSLNPALQNVLIIGDSISMGYTLPLRAELDGKANVIHAPQNCKSTRTILAHLDAWLAARHYDVVYINAGLHDLKHINPWDMALVGKDKLTTTNAGPRWVEPGEYASNLEQIVARLRTSGATVIFATTTPAPPDIFGRNAADIDVYNTAARNAMSRLQVPVSDLNTAARAAPQLPSNVHFTPQGYAVLAQTAAADITSALPHSLPRIP